MFTRTPLKRNTPLRAKTELKSKSKLKAKTPLKAVSDKHNKEAAVNTTAAKKRIREPNYVKDMDRVFQYWVRLRDAMPGGYTRCISCGKIKPFDQMQAGHFYGRACFSTRWHPDNVSSECIFDNCYNGEHLLGYRENLIKKIGIRRFENLTGLRNSTKKWSNFEIIMMIKQYGKEVLQLSASKHIPISKDVQAIIKRYQKMKL